MCMLPMVVCLTNDTLLWITYRIIIGFPYLLSLWFAVFGIIQIPQQDYCRRFVQALICNVPQVNQISTVLHDDEVIDILNVGGNKL